MKITWCFLTCTHLVLWISYSVIEWLSNKDSILAKMILLVMFFYLSYLIAFMIMKTRKIAIIFSFSSLTLFAITYQVFFLLTK